MKWQEREQYARAAALAKKLRETPREKSPAQINKERIIAEYNSKNRRHTKRTRK